MLENRFEILIIKHGGCGLQAEMKENEYYGKMANGRLQLMYGNLKMKKGFANYNV